MAARIFWVCVLLAVAACAPVIKRPDAILLQPVDFDALPGWSRGMQAGVLPAMARSCESLSRRPHDRSLHQSLNVGRVAQWLALCRPMGALEAGNNQRARQFFETHFQAFKVTNNGDAEGLFTGYYEAELRGSRRPSTRYWVPILALPGKQNRPLPDRAEIEDGALAGQGLELAWVDDPVDAFFLHIQGSGRVRLEDGAVLRLGYAGRNGHPYLSIGKRLIEAGEISREAMSMQAIRRWIKDNPGRGIALMRANPSYIFFRELGEEGPIGSQGVALTPGRSLAVDRRYLPLGVPLWLDTTDPSQGNSSLRRLVVAQDTGDAIRGPVRGDLFWGFGEAAAQSAGMMKQTGSYFLLLPRL